jgi:hypothetical protein
VLFEKWGADSGSAFNFQAARIPIFNICQSLIHRDCFAIGVGSKAAPALLLRLRDHSLRDWIAMDAAQFLDARRGLAFCGRSPTSRTEREKWGTPVKKKPLSGTRPWPPTLAHKTCKDGGTLDQGAGCTYG